MSAEQLVLNKTQQPAWQYNHYTSLHMLQLQGIVLPVFTLNLNIKQLYIRKYFPKSNAASKVFCNQLFNMFNEDGFLLMFNSNIWPNSPPLPDIRLSNVSDLEFDLSRSLKVKCDSII